jgi:hypothetical protein
MDFRDFTGKAQRFLGSFLVFPRLIRYAFAQMTMRLT